MNDQLSGKKCFITGGAGFIGSYLTDVLLQHGCTVTVYDNLTTGRRKWLPKNQLDHQLRFVEGDLSDYATLERAMVGHQIVWHFGANTNMVIGAKDPSVDFTNGLAATFHVLNAMKKLRIAELIFPSSGAVYGDILRPPADENYGPLLPVSTYGAAKLSAEGWISSYWHSAGIKSWIFRFGNVLGARMTHGVIYDLLGKLRADSNELEILGDGKGEKNYFLVEECIDGMIYAYSSARHVGCEIFNLGSESTTRVSEIARIILEETGNANTKVRYTGGERGWPGDQPRVYMNVEKMKRLGWRAKLSSHEAVRTAVRRYLGRA